MPVIIHIKIIQPLIVITDLYIHTSHKTNTTTVVVIQQIFVVYACMYVCMYVCMVVYDTRVIYYYSNT